MVESAPNVNAKFFVDRFLADLHTSATGPEIVTAPMIVQIYEIQEPDEVVSVVEMGVDHVGSVVTSFPEWKNPTLRTTVQEVQRASAKSALIPLYRDPGAVYRTLDYYRPDIVHFCDLLDDSVLKELVDLQAGVRQRFPEIDIMRSIPIAPKGRADGVRSLHYAKTLAPTSDWFLTDTLLVDASAEVADQPEKGFVGITGKTCDWETGRKLVTSFHVPVILAGGLGPENVGEGIRAVGPAGVDSCTLTNAVGDDGRPIRFKKDLEAVSRFVTESRRAASEINLIRRGEHPCTNPAT